MLRIFLLVTVAVASSGAPNSNNRPVIGIMAQPTKPKDPDLGGTSYIVASYVKWVEASGARVHPILYNVSTADLRKSFEQVSGVFFPGGHCGFHEGTGRAYGEASWQMMEWAREENDAGRHFPLWGTCQGHQQLAQFGSGHLSPSILKETAGTEDLLVPANFTPTARRSRILGAAPESVVQALGQEPVTIHLHHYSVTADKTNLSFYDVVATNVDANGLEFVSMLEVRGGGEG